MIGLWRSLVARLVRDEEAAGSNPVSPTDRPGAPTTVSRVSCVWHTARMADKDAQEPSLELPSLSFGRKRRKQKAEPAPVAPEPAPASAESAPVSAETAPVAPKTAPGSSETAPAAAVREASAAEPDRADRRRFSLPALGGLTASLVTGALVGILTVGLTWGGFRLCEVVQGTSSCGDPGFLLLLAIMIAMAVLGATLLGAWDVAEHRSTSVLAVGLLAVVTLLFLVDVLFSSWMILVIPVIAMATFAVAHWVTTAASDAADA